MKEQKTEILKIIKEERRFIVDEDNTDYDEAINELVEEGKVEWDEAEDDSLVLVK